MLPCTKLVPHFSSILFTPSVYILGTSLRSVQFEAPRFEDTFGQASFNFVMVCLHSYSINLLMNGCNYTVKWCIDGCLLVEIHWIEFTLSLND